MAIVTTNDDHYKSIANAIRKQSETSHEWYPQDMADGVVLACGVAKNKGYQEGETRDFRKVLRRARLRVYAKNNHAFGTFFKIMEKTKTIRMRFTVQRGRTRYTIRNTHLCRTVAIKCITKTQHSQTRKCRLILVLVGRRITCSKGRPL